MSIYKLLSICFMIVAFNISLFAEEVSSNKSESNTILNAIHSDDIRNIMRRLRMLIYDREYTELELRKLSSDQIKLLAEETNILAQTAENISNIASLKNLNDEEQLTFSAMANQFHDISMELQREAKANHQQTLDTAYLKLQNTCNTCHKLFRD
jgi:cytochrome c556